MIMRRMEPAQLEVNRVCFDCLPKK